MITEPTIATIQPTTPPTRTILMQIPIWDQPPAPAPAAPEPMLASHKTSQEPISAGQGRVAKDQKAYRLPRPLMETLKRTAYYRTIKTGVRVTETSLLIEALEQYLANVPEHQLVQR